MGNSVYTLSLWRRVSTTILLIYLLVAPEVISQQCQIPGALDIPDGIDTQALNDDELNSHAIKLAQTGKLYPAISIFQRLLKKSPTNSQGLMNLGVTYMRLGLYHLAEVSFYHALSVCKGKLDKSGCGKGRLKELKHNLASLSRYLPSRISDAQRNVSNIPRLFAVPPRSHIVKKTPQICIKNWKRGTNRRYRNGSSAFVLRRACENATAISSWNASFFLDNYGEEIVDHYSSNMVRESTRPSLYQFQVAMHDTLAATPSGGRSEGQGFCRSVLNKSLSSPADRSLMYKDRPGVYMMWNINMSMWDELVQTWLDGLDFLPDIFHSDMKWLKKCLPTIESRVDFFKATHWRMLVIGSPGAGMFGHKDIIGMGGYQIQIRGRKRWHVCPDGANDEFMYVDGFNPDYGEKPRFKNATCHDFISKPGDVVYWPGNWWHQTLVVGPTRSKRSSSSLSVQSEKRARASQSEISVGLSGSVVTASNYRRVNQQLKGACKGEGQVQLSQETCHYLPRCFRLWDEMFGSL